MELVWMPYELRPYPTPTLRPDGDYLQNAWRNSVYPLAARMGVEIRLPDVSPQPYTRLAFEGLEFAKEQGRGNEYNSAVMRAFFQRSEDIAQPKVLAQIASDTGLDDTLFEQALETRTYGTRVEKLLRHAYQELNVTGVPLFLIGKRELHGVQSRQALEAAIDQELAAR